MFGFTIIELNMPYIREQMLPELASRHFTHVEGDVYRVAVIATDDSSNPLYRSDPDAPVDPDRADASASLFGIGTQAFFFGRPPRPSVGDGPAAMKALDSAATRSLIGRVKDLLTISGVGVCSSSIRVDRSKAAWRACAPPEPGDQLRSASAPDAQYRAAGCGLATRIGSRASRWSLSRVFLTSCARPSR